MTALLSTNGPNMNAKLATAWQTSAHARTLQRRCVLQVTQGRGVHNVAHDVALDGLVFGHQRACTIVAGQGTCDPETGDPWVSLVATASGRVAEPPWTWRRCSDCKGCVCSQLHVCILYLAVTSANGACHAQATGIATLCALWRYTYTAHSWPWQS